MKPIILFLSAMTIALMCVLAYYAAHSEPMRAACFLAFAAILVVFWVYAYIPSWRHWDPCPGAYASADADKHWRVVAKIAEERDWENATNLLLALKLGYGNFYGGILNLNEKVKNDAA